VGETFGIDDGQKATRLCALNVLAHARAALDGDLDRIAAVAYLRGYVNVTPDFDQIAEVVNGASQVMLDVFGPEVGAHCRTAVGAASMPFNAAAEVEAEFYLA
jgi:enamine deaminase RidA (YjgF/YER057c/UK114 family)